MISQLALITTASLPLEHWKSFRDSASPAPPIGESEPVVT
jgi:hypothetical protein